MKLPVFVKDRTIKFWEKYFSAQLLFFSVMICFPAFLFQQKTEIIILETLLFFFLAFSRRGNIKILPSLLMILAVTFFSLLTPYGKVLFYIGGNKALPITLGALEDGLRRSFILVGMVFLSQFALSSKLTLPGKFGSFSIGIFSYLEKFRQDSIKITSGKIISSIDEKLIEVYKNELCADENSQISEQSHPFGYVFALLLPISLYLLLFF